MSSLGDDTGESDEGDGENEGNDRNNEGESRECAEGADGCNANRSWCLRPPWHGRLGVAVGCFFDLADL